MKFDAMDLRLKQIIEILRLLPGSYIDCGFGQGRHALIKQREQVQYYKFRGSADSLIISMREGIKRLQEWVSPYNLPNDYIEFLEYYSGLAIHQNGIRFMLFGIGPMAETWYHGIGGDEWFHEPGRYGFLSLADLHFRRHVADNFQHVTFFLDLAGNIKEHCIIGVGPWPEVAYPKSFEVIMNVDANAESWQILARSFTDFLHLAVETGGSFGYI